LYAPDERKNDGRAISFPIVVLAWAWSAGRVHGISVDTELHWVHSDDRPDHTYEDCMKLLGTIDSDERFAQHIVSGHLRFLGLVPSVVTPVDVARQLRIFPQAEETGQPMTLRAA
jgi:hypothetical protein